jgi:hypothetical protein
MKVVFFLLGLADVLILFASAIVLAIFVVKRLVLWMVRTFTAKPEAPKPVVPRERIYTGPLTGPATVRLPQHFKN